MNKIFIRTIFLIIFITSSACSYKPIFAEKIYNFEIIEIVYSGEKDVNKIINNKLGLIQKKDNASKKYSILINTKKKKKVISKDSQGDPLKFEYILIASYSIKENENTILSRDIEKEYIYNNDNDKFKLEQNENIILENLSQDIGDMIISSIINLNDN